MESNPLDERLHDLQKAEAAPYIHYRPVPKWWVPAISLWLAAVVATQTVPWFRADGASTATQVARIGIYLALAVLAGVMIAWYQRYNGTLPSLTGQKPPEIRRAYAVYFMAAAVTAGVVIALINLAQWWVTVPGTALLTGALFTGYHWYYNKAAAAARARLG